MKNLQSFASAMRRRLLSETDNLPALLGNDANSADPENPKEIQRPVDVISLGSGSFPAFPGIYGDALTPLLPEDIDATAVQQLSTKVAQSTDVEMSGTKYSKWAYIITIPAVILLIALIVLIILVLRKRGRASVAPWKTGLSGPIQKALVTGETLLLFFLILHLGRECMQSLKRVTFCIGNYPKFCATFVRLWSLRLPGFLGGLRYGQFSCSMCASSYTFISQSYLCLSIQVLQCVSVSRIQVPKN